MPSRLIVPLVALVIAAVVAGVVVAGGGGDDDDGGEQASVAAAAGEQLSYLDPDSSLVAAIDLRYEEPNWEHLRELASRGLREYRALADDEGEDDLPVPPNVTGALNQLASFVGLSFDEDVKPLMDGYLTIGVTVPPRPELPPELAEIEDRLDGARPAPNGRFTKDGRVVRGPDGRPLSFRDTQRVFEAQSRLEDEGEPETVVAYRTESDGLPRVVERLLEGDEPEPIRGFPDAQLLDPEIALVGDDTLVFATGGASEDTPSEGPASALAVALARAENDQGYPRSGLAEAQRSSGAGDPLVLASGSLDLARLLVEERNLERAQEEVAWLGAVRGISGAVAIDDSGLDGILRADTSGAGLGEADLPVGGPAEVDLPTRDDAIVSGTSDQSVTTAFMARLARSLFADSDFVEAVERTERELGIDFEQEFLLQFGCPSVSVFEPGSQRFAARSCVEDPGRMRRLLPRLAPFLPEILTGLQGLDSEGLVTLLLVAPDAPLTPFTNLAQVLVDPLTGGEEPDEQLYTVRGLRDPADPVGPDRVVFGMIGDTFVVGTDREAARGAAELETERHGERAATASRVPAELLLAQTDPELESRLVARLIEDVVAGTSADPAGLTAEARLDFRH